MGEPVGPSDHASHDLLAVAEAADRGRSLPPGIAACPDCAALHADLVAMAAALPSSALPTRPRDYTLTAADVARLRPRGWRWLVAAIGSSRDVVSRPLAIGFTTLGLAGLLVATVPGSLPMGGAGAAPETVSAPDHAAGGAAASAAPAREVPAPAASVVPMMVSSAPEVAAGDGAEPTDDDVFSGEDAGDAAAPATADAATRQEAGPANDEAAIDGDATGPSTLVVVAGAFLIAGLGLFGLRWSTRRLD